jgi:uncharacterized repeat protein (TIGR01451 family)
VDSNFSQWQITAVDNPGISLTKRTDQTLITEAGTAVTYTFEVTNTGNQTLTDVHVTDRFTQGGTGSLSAITCPETTLAPGQSTLCQATYETVAADLKVDSVDNEAIAHGTTPPDPSNTPGDGTNPSATPGSGDDNGSGTVDSDPGTGNVNTDGSGETAQPGDDGSPASRQISSEPSTATIPVQAPTPEPPAPTSAPAENPLTAPLPPEFTLPGTGLTIPTWIAVLAGLLLVAGATGFITERRLRRQ